MRLRIAFSKHGKIRFTSHRDVARILSAAPLPPLKVGMANTAGEAEATWHKDYRTD